MTSRANPVRSSIAGFTLLEALLSVALMGFVLASLATLTAQWLPNWNRGIASVQRQEALALGIDRLISDLSSAEYVSFAGDNTAPVFRGSEHSVIFVRRARGPNTSAGLELVRLSENDSRNGVVMMRQRAPFAPAGLDAEVPNFTDPVVLVRAPFRVLFAYSDEQGKWHPQWQNLPRLPRAIKVTVVDLATGAPLASSSSAVIHAEAPFECIASKEAGCLTGAAARRTDDATRPGTARPADPGRLR